MAELESQIAKIQLGEPKQTNTFVHTLAEKAEGSEAELFFIIELPLKSLENFAESENIALSVVTAFRRVYKKPIEQNSFENAISEINEELGKLASLGNTEWVNKIHSILAVKHNQNFYISTTGKVSAFLLRNGEFTDISCSGETGHPLKTFETFALGKIRLNDLLILSSTKLFNYLSLDKFKDLVLNANFLNATRTVIALLKENAGPTVAFGTILNLQVPFGEAEEQNQDLETYETNGMNENKFSEKFSGIFSFWKKASLPKVQTPNLQTGMTNLKKWGASFTSFGKFAYFGAKKVFSSGKQAFSWNKIKNYSPQKKFFFISAFVLLVVTIFNIALAVHFKNQKTAENKTLNNLKEAKTLLAKASDSLLYKDEQKAREYLQLAFEKMPKSGETTTQAVKAQFDEVNPLLEELKQKIDKNIQVSVENLGALSSGEVLLNFSNALGTESNGSITSIDLTTKKILDGAFKFSGKILGSVLISPTTKALVSEKGLVLWSPADNKINSLFTINVPEPKDFGGITFYPDNKKVYLLNKNSGQIFSFTAGQNGFSKSTQAVFDERLKKAQSITVDGNIYALTDSLVLKYTKGVPQKFDMPFLIKPFSGNGKIYTQKDFNNLYLLDFAQKRILVLSKTGQLVGSITNSSFVNPKDFLVNEKTKTIYLLNDASLFKVSW